MKCTFNANVIHKNMDGRVICEFRSIGKYKKKISIRFEFIRKLKQGTRTLVGHSHIQVVGRSPSHFGQSRIRCFSSTLVSFLKPQLFLKTLLIRIWKSYICYLIKTMGGGDSVDGCILL